MNCGYFEDYFFQFGGNSEERFGKDLLRIDNLKRNLKYEYEFFRCCSILGGKIQQVVFQF